MLRRNWIMAGVISAFGLLRVIQADDASELAKLSGDYQRPELVAIAWGDSSKTISHEKAIWKPDGTLLSGDERDRFVTEAKSLHALYKGQSGFEAPLLLFFRLDERAKSQQSLRASVLVSDGVKSDVYFAMNSTENRLAETQLSLGDAPFDKLPERITIEVRAPIAEPQELRVDRGTPREAVYFGLGVCWYIDPNRGAKTINGRRTEGFPAVVQETDRNVVDPLSDYWLELKLKDGAECRVGFHTIKQGAPNVAIDVSQALDDKNPLESARAMRRDHRLEYYVDVAIHPELLNK